MKRIYVDFNTVNFDAHERVLIPIEQGVPSSIEEGLRAMFFDETLEVEGVVEFDPQFNFWLGRLDWSTKRDL